MNEAILMSRKIPAIMVAGALALLVSILLLFLSHRRGSFRQ